MPHKPLCVVSFKGIPFRFILNTLGHSLLITSKCWQNNVQVLVVYSCLMAARKRD